MGCVQNWKKMLLLQEPAGEGVEPCRVLCLSAGMLLRRPMQLPPLLVLVGAVLVVALSFPKRKEKGKKKKARTFFVRGVEGAVGDCR